MEGSTLTAGGRQGLGAPLRVLGDEALARMAARGNQAAFSAIFDRHHQALYRYALTILGNREDAFDAVQNAIVKLLRSLPGEEREIKLEPWLYRIVHNEAISMIRQRAPRSEHPVEEAETEDSPHDRMRAQAIIADLAELGDQQRSAVAMRELNGLSHAEIAQALEISEAAAKQTVYEGRVALQQIEEGREMNCSDVQETISANDRRLIKGRRVRSHLRSCVACRSFEASIRERRVGLAAIAPLSAVLSGKLLAGALGGGGGPAGGLMIGAAGSGAGGLLGAGALAKVGAAVVLMVGGGIAIEHEVGHSQTALGPEQAEGSAAPRAEPVTSFTETAGAGHRLRGMAAVSHSSLVALGHGSTEPKGHGSGPGSAGLHQSGGRQTHGGGSGGSRGSLIPGGPGNGSGGSGSGGHHGGHGGPPAETPIAQPSTPVETPASHGNGPANGQAIAESNDPGDPGNSAGHAQDPDSPPGLSGDATGGVPAAPSAPNLPPTSNGHGQSLGLSGPK